MSEKEKFLKTKKQKTQNLTKATWISFFIQIVGLGLITGSIATDHVVKIMIAIGIILIFLAIVALGSLIIFNKASKNLT